MDDLSLSDCWYSSPRYTIGRVFIWGDKTCRLLSKVGKFSIVFRDSYFLFNQSLDNLGKNLEIYTIKGQSPHAFVNRDRLEYVGNLPDFHFFKNIDPRVYTGTPSPYDLREVSIELQS